MKSSMKEKIATILVWIIALGLCVAMMSNAFAQFERKVTTQVEEYRLAWISRK